MAEKFELGNLRCCRRCAFFAGDDKGGTCQRNPPTMVILPGKNALGQTGLQPSSAFPPVTPTTWCGEWAPMIGVTAGAA